MRRGVDVAGRVVGHAQRDRREQIDRPLDDLRGLVTQNIDSKTIKQAATRKGMRTLRADGALKVLQGVTSVAEILRATEEEGVVAEA